MAKINGRAFLVLTVVDHWSRESPLLEVGILRTGKHVVGAFEDRVGPKGPPESIPVGNDTGFTSKAVEAWACYPGVELDFTRPGKPTDNGHIESCNGHLRD